MHNRSVSDPEINLGIHNMLQRVMVCLLCGSHLGRHYSKPLDLIVAQPGAPSDEASVSSTETDKGKGPKISTRKSKSFTAAHMVSCFNHQRLPVFHWKIRNHLQGKRRMEGMTIWGEERLKDSRRRKVRREGASMGGFYCSNIFPFLCSEWHGHRWHNSEGWNFKCLSRKALDMFTHTVRSLSSN